MKKESTFVPAKYTTSAHIQTMWPTFIMRRRPALETTRERFELEDGDSLISSGKANPLAPLLSYFMG